MIKCLLPPRCLLTSGVDGDVRVYKSIDDDDAVSFRAGNRVTAIAVKVTSLHYFHFYLYYLNIYFSKLSLILVIMIFDYFFLFY